MPPEIEPNIIEEDEENLLKMIKQNLDILLHLWV